MCSCQKKRDLELLRQKQVVLQNVPATSNDLWGPILWKFLHVAAERSYSTKFYIDTTNLGYIWNNIIQRLPYVLPCPDCQAHARTYLQDHPFDATDYRGQDLQSYVRQYIFEFHTDVRIQKGQPTLVNSIEECQRLYETQEYAQLNTDTLLVYFRIAMKYQVVQSMPFNKWKMNYDQLVKLTHLY